MQDSFLFVLRVNCKKHSCFFIKVLGIPICYVCGACKDIKMQDKIIVSFIK
mgnify:CR=1 FL=1|jgi:hypothetical protein